MLDQKEEFVTFLCFMKCWEDTFLVRTVWLYFAGMWISTTQNMLLPLSSCNVTVRSTYSHQCLPSVDTGISHLDHLQARWMQTHATTVGLYCRQKVVRCKLQETRNAKDDCQLTDLRTNLHDLLYILLFNRQTVVTVRFSYLRITYTYPYLTGLPCLKPISVRLCS